MADVAPSPAGTPPTAPGQSPPGSSPATSPVPNRGQEAAGLATMNVLANALLKLATQMGASSDPGKDALKAAQLLLKHVPPGSTSPGVENNAMMGLMRNQSAQQPMAQMAAARGGQPPPPAAAPPAA